MNVFFQSFREQLRREKIVYFLVKAIPNAPVTGVKELLRSPDGEPVLKIAVTATAEKGKANKELCRYLSTIFQVSKNAVVISQGQSSRLKLIKIRL